MYIVGESGEKWLPHKTWWQSEELEEAIFPPQEWPIALLQVCGNVMLCVLNAVEMSWL